MKQSILNLLALRENVAPCFLEEVGIQDESETIGKILYLFNIMDTEHPKFASTVAYMTLT